MKQKKFIHKFHFLLIFVIIITFLNNFCHSEGKHLIQENKSMENYIKLFADFRLTSMQDRIIKAEGKLNWFLPSMDGDYPRLLLNNNVELLVKYSKKYQLVKDQNIIYESGCNFDKNIVFNEKSILYTEDSFVKLFDNIKQEEHELCDVPVITSESIWKCIYQLDGNIFIQILNRAKEESNLVFPGSSSSSSNPDDYSDKTVLLVMDAQQKVIWSKEFVGENLQSLIMEDTKQVIAFYYDDPYSNSISIYDLNSGKEQNKIKTEKASILNASLNFNNQLNLILQTSENEYILRNYSLDGKINWEYFLPINSAEYVNQPPAVNKLNQVYCLINSTVYLIDNGRLLGSVNIPNAPYFRFLTVTGDNKFLVVSSYILSYYDSNGNLIFNYLLEQDDSITTPPVIDENGLIYFGSTKGIYSIK